MSDPPTRDEKMAKYKSWLLRGAEIHGGLSAATAGQIRELQEFVDHASEDQDESLARVMLAVHEVEQAVHTMGLTVALAGLAVVGALGEDVPDPPDLPERGPEPDAH